MATYLAWAYNFFYPDATESRCVSNVAQGGNAKTRDSTEDESTYFTVVSSEPDEFAAGEKRKQCYTARSSFSVISLAHSLSEAETSINPQRKFRSVLTGSETELTEDTNAWSDSVYKVGCDGQSHDSIEAVQNRSHEQSIRLRRGEMFEKKANEFQEQGQRNSSLYFKSQFIQDLNTGNQLDQPVVTAGNVSDEALTRKTDRMANVKELTNLIIPSSAAAIKTSSIIKTAENIESAASATSSTGKEKLVLKAKSKSIMAMLMGKCDFQRYEGQKLSNYANKSVEFNCFNETENAENFKRCEILEDPCNQFDNFLNSSKENYNSHHDLSSSHKNLDKATQRITPSVVQSQRCNKKNFVVINFDSKQERNSELFGSCKAALVSNLNRQFKFIVHLDELSPKTPRVIDTTGGWYIFFVSVLATTALIWGIIGNLLHFTLALMAAMIAVLLKIWKAPSVLFALNSSIVLLLVYDVCFVFTDLEEAKLLQLYTVYFGLHTEEIIFCCAFLTYLFCNTSLSPTEPSEDTIFPSVAILYFKNLNTGACLNIFAGIYLGLFADFLLFTNSYMAIANMALFASIVAIAIFKKKFVATSLVHVVILGISLICASVWISKYPKTSGTKVTLQELNLSIVQLIFYAIEIILLLLASNLFAWCKRTFLRCIEYSHKGHQDCETDKVASIDSVKSFNEACLGTRESRNGDASSTSPNVYKIQNGKQKFHSSSTVDLSLSKADQNEIIDLFNSCEQGKKVSDTIMSTTLPALLQSPHSETENTKKVATNGHVRDAYSEVSKASSNCEFRRNTSIRKEGSTDVAQQENSSVALPAAEIQTEKETKTENQLQGCDSCDTAAQEQTVKAKQVEISTMESAAEEAAFFNHKPMLSHTAALFETVPAVEETKTCGSTAADTSSCKFQKSTDSNAWCQKEAFDVASASLSPTPSKTCASATAETKLEAPEPMKKFINDVSVANDYNKSDENTENDNVKRLCTSSRGKMNDYKMDHKDSKATNFALSTVSDSHEMSFGDCDVQWRESPLENTYDCDEDKRIERRWIIQSAVARGLTLG